MVQSIAQGRVPDFNSGQFNGQQQSSVINPLDTIERPDLIYTAYLLSDLRVPIYNLDTFVNDIHVLEPQYKADFISPNLGSDNSGSQSQPWYVPEEGVRMGSHFFDQVLSSTASPHLIEVNRSFAEIHVVRQGQGLGRHRGASNFNAKFYRSFARNILLNFNYHSYNDDGDRSLFGNDQDAQLNTLKRLNLKMSQKSKHGNRITYINYDRPAISQNVNRNFYGTADVISIAQNARTFEIGNSIVFKDSLAAQPKFTLDSKLSFVTNGFSSTSTNLATNGSDFIIIDLPGDTLSYVNNTSEIRLSNVLKKSFEGGLLKVGVDVNNVKHSLGAIERQNYFESILSLGYAKKLSDKLDIAVKSKLGLLDASGLAVLKGDLDYVYSEDLQFQMEGGFKSTVPSLLHRKLIVNNTVYSDENWNNPSGVFLNVRVAYKPTETSIGLSMKSFKNLFTISNTGTFEQLESSVNRLSLQLNQDLKLGPFHTSHAVRLQTISDDNFTVPKINYTGNVFLQFYLFKKRMLTRLGADVYFLPSFDLPEFYAVTGEFYNNGQAVGNSLVIVNPYLNAKVGPFHIFVKGMDVLHRLRSTDLLEVNGGQVRIFDYSLVSGLPRHDFKLRFGIKWTFLD